MKFVQYGTPNGTTVIYFHGAPGAPEECVIFDKYASEHKLNIICYDRFSVGSALKGEAYYQYLAEAILSKTNGAQIDLVGFSIGCQAAIKTSVYLKDSTRSLHLISAAAPLDGGNFLDKMAGKMVFSLAIKQETVFRLLSYWQTFLSKFAPTILFKMLFASADGEDRKLSKSIGFQQYITPILRHCFGNNVQGYIKEITQYLTPWHKDVINCVAPTHIWHGLDDNWSPVEMAHYLDESLPNVKSIELMQGLSHYSCLHSAAPKICAQITKS